MTNPPPSVFELRQYTLRPGRRDELIDLFERVFIEPQEALGITLAGLFRDAHDPDRFVWIRGFADLAARKAALEAFYGGPVWRAHRDAANATMIDSDNVLLLQSVSTAFLTEEGARVHGSLFCATYEGSRSLGSLTHTLETSGARIAGAFVTDPSPNTFPKLPVREGAEVLVILADRLERETLAATEPLDIVELVPTARSAMRLAAPGAPGDFTFLEGVWNVRHRRLRSRLSGCDEWEHFDGSARGHTLLDGLISVDEIAFAPGTLGASFRHLDLVRRRWSIFWTTNRSGALFAPVHGGFDEHRVGTFYGNDSENGRAVLARYLWTACETSSPRWEQAFSVDGGHTWETNWIMAFTRASQA